jgi:hypothetical protein
MRRGELPVVKLSRSKGPKCNTPILHHSKSHKSSYRSTKNKSSNTSTRIGETFLCFTIAIVCLL